MNSILKLVFLVYFITHIPISLCLDFQALLGTYYPETLKDLQRFYTNTYNDPLFITSPIWFKSFIFCEILFQFPFFFVATYGLLYEKNWIRIPSIIYGTHVATTLVPILSEFAFNDQLSEIQKLTLFGFYFPYFLIPAILAIVMSVSEKPFDNNNSKTKKK